LGLGNEERTLKASRAYIAGVGTTGVLIASFLMLLTVGSTLVAFRGVPGAPSNGDLSSIELRQQREAAQQSGTLIVSSDSLGEAGLRNVAGSGAVLGGRASAAGGWPAGQIDDGFAGSVGPDALQPGAPAAPRTPIGEKAPPGVGPAPAPGAAPGTPISPGRGLGGTPSPGAASAPRIPASAPAAR